MELQLTLQGEKNLIRQIYRQLRQAVLEGRLAAGDRLPSTRELASQLNVARKTVTLAYDLLFSEGIIGGRPGSGTFVSDHVPRAPQKDSRRPSISSIQVRPAWQNAAPHTFFPADRTRYSFRVGVPDISSFPFAVWRNLLVAGSKAAAVSGYDVDPTGLPELRQAIAKYIAFTRAVRCEASDILITNGAQEAFDLIGRVLLGPADTVAVEEPGYPPIRWVLESQGAHVSGVPIDEEGILIDRIPKRTKAIYVTPSHQFPTGGVMSLSRRLALIEWAASRGIAVIEDDYDSEFRFEGRSLESLQNLDLHGVVLYVGTFSKILFPAIRLGFIVAPKPLLAALSMAKCITDGHSSLLKQAALAKFIQQGHLGRHVRRMRRLYSNRRALLLAGIKKTLSPWLVPISSSAGLHVSAYAVPDLDDLQLTRLAKRSDVGVRPLSPFFKNADSRHGLVLGYGATNLQDIEEGLRRLASILQKTGSAHRSSG
jgi:GntR family transcriptional regulator / MocR family aminotransferase